MTNFIRIAGITSILAFSSVALILEASAAQVEEDNIEHIAESEAFGDPKSYQDALQELENFATTHNIDFEITSISLGQNSKGQDYTVMDTHCTVTGSVNIAGQSFSMEATATTCGQAVGLVQEGLAASIT